MRTRHRPRVAALVALALLTAGCSGDEGSGRNTGGGYVGGDGSYIVVEPAKRQEPVELSGTTLAGKPLNLADYRGEPVVINVWGSWCPPCIKEAPALQAASLKLAEQGVKVVGINTRDDGGAQAQAFERTHGITFPSIVDKGTALLALRGAVSPKAIPTTLVLDAQGRIAARSTAAVTETTLLNLVEDATGVKAGT